MNRHDELRKCLTDANAIFGKHSVMCRASAWEIGDQLNAYLGKKVVGYVNWDNDTASSENRPLTEVAFWADEEEPEMIVGLTVKILTFVKNGDAEFSRLFRLSLKPCNEKVIAEMDETLAELVVADEEGRMKFIDSATKDRFLASIFQTLKDEVSVPMHKRRDKNVKFGFAEMVGDHQRE
jgi:hypothetical protein